MIFLKFMVFMIFIISTMSEATYAQASSERAILTLSQGEDPSPRVFSMQVPWQCEDGSKNCQEYKSRFINEMNFLRQHQNSALHGVFAEKGRELEAKLDAIFIDFRIGQSTLEQTISKLEIPSMFDNTGFVAGLFPSPYKFVGVPGDSVSKIWSEQVFGGSSVVPPQRGGASNHFTQPGKIMVRQPVFENGFGPENIINYSARLQYLMILAEEFYHASQHMQGKNLSPHVFAKEKLISNYFASYDLNQLARNHPARMKPALLLEVDVYAKMLEVIGIKYVPEFIRSLYPDRDLVDINLIKLQ